MHLIRLVNFRSYQTYDHLLHRHQNPRLLKFHLEEPVYVCREGQSQSCIKSECIRERERERERMKARARARERGKNREVQMEERVGFNKQIDWRIKKPK